MSEPGRRRPRIRIRWQYVILVVLMALFTVKFVQKTQELRTLTQEAAALRLENRQTLRDNARTRAAIRYYRTTEYVKEQARGILGYTLPGDLTIMSQPHYQRAVVRRAPVRPVALDPTWKQWWHSFF